jgi:hypothetical protein
VVAPVMAARNAEEEIAQKAAKIAKSQRGGALAFINRPSSSSFFVLDFPALPFGDRSNIKVRGSRRPKPALHSIVLCSDQSGQTFDLSPVGKPSRFTRLRKS